MKKVYGLCVLSLIISIAAFCVSYVRCAPFEIDNFDSIMATLSILVTILIGWQIYNYMFIKEEMEKRMSAVTKEAFSDFFHVLTGYINANSETMICTREDEGTFDNYFKCLNEVKKSKEANMTYFAVNFIINKMIEATSTMTKRNQKGILTGRKDYYLRVLSSFDHDGISEIIHYINTAEEVPDTSEWLRRQGRLAE